MHEATLATDTPLQAKTPNIGNASQSYKDIHEAPLRSSETMPQEETGIPPSNPDAKPLWWIWGPEMASTTLSVAVFIGKLLPTPLQSKSMTDIIHLGIVIVLLNFDQEPLPSWPMGITLNSLLAFLTTVAKATFIVPVSTAISQTQWTWLNRGHPKPLYDLYIFDQASRGALGSLLLLWKIRSRDLVLLGALLMFISGITSPVTQLAVNYPVRSAAVSEAEQEAFLSSISCLNGSTDFVYTGTHKAILSATFLDSTFFEKPILYTTAAAGREAVCSTGNCTFPPYLSLGVCMELANISSFLHVEEFDSPDSMDTELTTEPVEESLAVWRASLPGSHYLAHQSEIAALTDILSGNATFAFKKSPKLQQARIASFVTINTVPTVYGNQSTSEGPSYTIKEFRHEAHEILFHLCVQTYQTNVSEGMENTKIVGSLTEPLLSLSSGQPFVDMKCTTLSNTTSWACERQWDRHNEILSFKTNVSNTISPPDMPSIWADYGAIEAIAMSMRHLIAGVTFTLPGNPLNGTPTVGSVSNSDFGLSLHQYALFGRDTTFNPEHRQLVLTNIFQNVATSLSAM
ncbi:hypothetical protein GQ607_002697 [Colletotrichum asianum]|uniref:Uncharacterized protein n=1 Tax=Colletotrichum asianum TaxID=702518 RepID=A0A8H3WNN9_9PEZI|nr:hypothetical protein GQ607_002697 [Colletotrichum asianum]